MGRLPVAYYGSHSFENPEALSYMFFNIRLQFCSQCKHEFLCEIHVVRLFRKNMGASKQ